MSNKGVVTKIATRQVKTKFGMKDAFSLQIDGDWYGHGFKRPPVAEGDTVTFEFKEGSYGKDITRIDAQIAALGKGAVSTGSAPVVSNRGGYDRTFPVALLSPERAIIRQNALAHAAKLYTERYEPNGGLILHTPEGISVHTANIIKLAREFEAYACGDTEREDVKNAE